jgi:cell division protease FtsH
MKINPLLKNFIVIVLILVAVAGIFSILYLPRDKPTQISISQLVSDINADKVKKIDVSGDDIAVTYTDDKTAESMKESNSVLSDVLANLGVNKDKLQKVEISAGVPHESVWSWLFPALLYGILPLLLIGFFFWTMMRQTNRGAGRCSTLPEPGQEFLAPKGHDKTKITFKDVAGLKEAKEELVEIVDFLKFPKKYWHGGKNSSRRFIG